MITLIAAFGKNHELGRDSGKPLWQLPDEYSRFRLLIKGHPIIMGRKSFDVIEKPLDDSLNIVVTRKKDYDGNGAVVVHSLKDAIATAGDSDEIFVIGGGQIFSEAIDVADKMELSLIDATFPDADAFFPDFDKNDWELTSSVKHEIDDDHSYVFHYNTWVRKDRK